MDLRLDLGLLHPRDLGQTGHVDLVVEVPDVGHDRLVLHALHLLGGDHVEAAGAGDEDVRRLHDVVEASDLEALHRGLERTDGVDLGDDDPGTLARERLGAALADVAEAHDHGDLAADEDVGGAVQTIDERVTAAVLVVELALGDRVVDVDRREEQVAGLRQLVETVYTGRGLLGDAPDALGDSRPLLRVGLERLADELLEHPELLGVLVGGGRDLTRRLPLGALVDEHRGVAAVVEDHVRALAARPGEDLVRAPPVLRQSLALPGEDRDALGVVRRAAGADDHRGRGLVLGGVDVAGGPADLGTERGERLDQDRRLDGHVERPRDAGALERLRGAVLLAQSHEAGHLVLGKPELVAAGLGEAQVGNLVVKGHDGSIPYPRRVCGPGVAHLGAVCAGITHAGRRRSYPLASRSSHLAQTRPIGCLRPGTEQNGRLTGSFLA